jgi:hypothetical protein
MLLLSVNLCIVAYLIYVLWRSRRYRMLDEGAGS